MNIIVIFCRTWMAYHPISIIHRPSPSIRRATVWFSPLATVVQCRHRKLPMHTSRRESRWWCHSIVLKCAVENWWIYMDLPHSTGKFKWEHSDEPARSKKDRLHYVTRFNQTQVAARICCLFSLSQRQTPPWEIRTFPASVCTCFSTFSSYTQAMTILGEGYTRITTPWWFRSGGALVHLDCGAQSWFSLWIL